MRRRFLSNIKEEEKYLTIIALEATTVDTSLTASGYIEARVNYAKWEKVSMKAYDLNKGDILQYRGNLMPLAGIGNAIYFRSTGKIDLTGDCTSILKDRKLFAYCFANAFSHVPIVNVSPDFLPSIELTPYCYQRMFESCVYLETVPDLPALELEDGCYTNMFAHCTSITKAPDLPALNLAEFCYDNMFYECSNLNYIKALFIERKFYHCTQRWTEGVSSTGTFVKNPEATWDIVGVDGVPKGWTVKFDGEEEGLDTWLEFPLYFDFDACEKNGFIEYCYRNPDDTSEELVRVIKYLFDKYGVPEILDNAPDKIFGYYITSQTLESLGINIYFKEFKVIKIHSAISDPYNFTLYLDGSYEMENPFGWYDYISMVIIRDNGEIFMEI